MFGGPVAVDQRLSTLDATIATFASMPHNPERPTRPGSGSLGKVGALRANLFAVKFPKDAVLYDYRVEFSPKTDLKSIKARLFTLLEQSAQSGWKEYVPFIAHDASARLVSSKELPQPLDVSVLFLKEGQAKPGKQDKTYTISIIATGEHKTNELDWYDRLLHICLAY